MDRKWAVVGRKQQMKFGRKEENTKSSKVHIDADRNPLLHTPKKFKKMEKKTKKRILIVM